MRKDKTIQFRISRELYNQLIELSIKHSMTVSQILRAVIKQVIENEKENK